MLEKTLESLLECKEIQPVHPKGNQSWVFIGRTDAEAETLILLPPDVKSWTHLKRPWCWERLKEGGDGDNRGWDGWMVSSTWWMWVWVSSESWWWTGKPSMLRSMGSQRVRHNWVSELNWTSIGAPHLKLSKSTWSTCILLNLCLLFGIWFHGRYWPALDFSI